MEVFEIAGLSLLAMCLITLLCIWQGMKDVGEILFRIEHRIIERDKVSGTLITKKPEKQEDAEEPEDDDEDELVFCIDEEQAKWLDKILAITNRHEKNIEINSRRSSENAKQIEDIRKSIDILKKFMRENDEKIKELDDKIGEVYYE